MSFSLFVCSSFFFSISLPSSAPSWHPLWSDHSSDPHPAKAESELMALSLADSRSILANLSEVVTDLVSTSTCSTCLSQKLHLHLRTRPAALFCESKSRFLQVAKELLCFARCYTFVSKAERLILSIVGLLAEPQRRNDVQDRTAGAPSRTAHRGTCCWNL